VTVVRARSFTRVKPGFRMTSFVEWFHEDLILSGRKAWRILRGSGEMKVYNFGEAQTGMFQADAFPS
jgi:hypothetical protein